MSNIFSDMFARITLARLLEAFASISSARDRAAVSPPAQTPTASPNGRSQSFSEIIKQASEQYGVNENLIQAVINQESSFNANAVSSCGAQGLMQLMPATAKSLGVVDPFDVEQNIMAGTKYLKEKLDEFGGNVSLALAAYNAGSGAVHKYAGIPPYKETQNYVSKIMKSIDYMA